MNIIRKLTYVLAASAAIAAPIGAMADEKVIITHSNTGFAFLPLLVADSMNYFDQAGLDVEMLKTGSGSKAFAAVVGGSGHIYIGATASAMSARSNNVEASIFAPLVNQLTSSIVISHAWAESHNVGPDSTMEEKLQALKGIRIATSSPGSGSTSVVRYLAQSAGLDPERDLTIVSIGNSPGVYLAAMSNDQIDAFVASPPETHVAVEELGSWIMFNTAVGEVEELDGYFYIGAIALDEWLASHESEATKFVQAMQLSLDALADNDTAAVAREAVYGKYFADVDKETFDVIWNDQRRASPKTVIMSSEMLDKVVEFTNALSDEKLDPAMASQAYTNKYAEAARAALNK